MYLLKINKHSTDSEVVKTCSTILHRYLTGFTVVKTCITIRFRQSTGFAVVKMGFRNICSSLIGSTVVKTGLLNLYRLSTSIAEVKIAMTIPTCFKLALRLSKLAWRKSTGLHLILWFCSCQNLLRKYLQAFNKLCGSPNVHDDSPQAFNGLCGS